MLCELANSYLQICNVLVMVFAQIKEHVISQLELALVIQDFREICVKVKTIYNCTYAIMHMVKYDFL